MSAPQADASADGEDPVEALAVAVPLEEGESVRRELSAAGLLREDLRVRQDGDELLLPVREEVPGRPTRRADFEVVERGPADYRELLELPDDVVERLPSSHDRIGDLVVFKLPEDLEPYKAMVGEALRTFANARTVALDHGVEGRHRVRDLEVVAGDPGTETPYREHGVEMTVDPARAYFSPRLATERRRVAEQVRPGEHVVDAFAGVGPFSLVVARLADPGRIDAVEVNPDAVELLRRNVEAAGAGDRVHVHEGDAADLLPRLGPADRIVMNLPHDAETYLPAARQALAEGGTIHLYVHLDHDDVDDRVAALEEAGLRVAGRRNVHDYSPASAIYVLDLEAPA